jgi:hypothetical protein
MGKVKKVRAADAAHRADVSDISLEALLGEMYSEEPLPPNYHTSHEWAELWGLGPSQSKNHINTFIANGVMEMRWKRQADFLGRAHRVPAYGIVKKER